MSVAVGLVICVLASGFLGAVMLRDRNGVQKKKENDQFNRMVELSGKRERRQAGSIEFRSIEKAA